MTTDIEDPDTSGIEQEHHLESEPGKVWRALSQSELREVWLPDQGVVEVLSEDPPKTIELLMEERDPPHSRSVVRFEVSPAPQGGTSLNIRHVPCRMLMAANDGGPVSKAA